MSFFELKVQLSDHEMNGEETRREIEKIAGWVSEYENTAYVHITDCPETKYRDGGVE
jgi:hypothetical protein